MTAADNVLSHYIISENSREPDGAEFQQLPPLSEPQLLISACLIDSCSSFYYVTIIKYINDITNTF